MKVIKLFKSWDLFDYYTLFQSFKYLHIYLYNVINSNDISVYKDSVIIQV